MTHIVYKTTNLINGKIYVGKHSTDDIDDGYIGSGLALKSAIGKYGQNNFECVILTEFKTEQEAFNEEAHIVDMNFVNRTDTYNLRTGGDGGFIQSEETIQKKIKATTGQKRSTATKLAISKANTGKKRTSEQNLRSSQQRTGSKLSKYHIQRISLGHIGLTHSVETKKKMSISARGPRPNACGRQAWNTGKKQDIIICPYCDKAGGTVNMNRYHFENCKYKD